MGESLRGVWKCRTDRSRAYRTQETAAHVWVKTGKSSYESIQGCGKWNVYVSTVPIEEDNRRGLQRKIDLRCMHCQRRVKFIPSRGTARGRQRPIIWYRRPAWEPVHALKKEARARNALDKKEQELLDQLEAGEITEADLPHFRRASLITE